MTSRVSSPNSQAAGRAAEIPRGLRAAAEFSAGYFLLLCAAWLAALASAGPGIAQPSPALSVQDAWMRATIASRPAAGYFTLSNAAAAAKELVGAASPACGMLLLHQSLHQNGVERMVMVQAVAVPAHGTVKFAPGGYHLMCMSPGNDVRAGHSIRVTLKFKDGSTLSAAFPVRGIAAN